MTRYFPESIDSIRNSIISNASDGNTPEERTYVSETAYEDFPEDIQRYVKELKLLYYVPLSYIIADERLLPDESLRFFYIDENWTNALADGALSIGRVTERDAAYDSMILDRAAEKLSRRLHLPRLEKMHPNHLGSALNVFKANGRMNANFSAGENESIELTLNAAETGGLITGFIMRSELASRAKDFNVTAYEGGSPISELRLTSLADDIIIGLYDGKITSLKISEPQTGLTFGLDKNETRLIPKDVSESSFGEPLNNKSIDMRNYTNGAGRIDVTRLAAKLGESLNTDVKSAKLAFELMTVAASAVFEEKN